MNEVRRIHTTIHIFILLPLDSLAAVQPCWLRHAWNVVEIAVLNESLFCLILYSIDLEASHWPESIMHKFRFHSHVDVF